MFQKHKDAIDKIFLEHPEIEYIGAGHWDIIKGNPSCFEHFTKFNNFTELRIPAYVLNLNEKTVSKIIENNPNIEEVSMKSVNYSLLQLKKLKHVEFYGIISNTKEIEKFISESVFDSLVISLFDSSKVEGIFYALSKNKGIKSLKIKCLNSNVQKLSNPKKSFEFLELNKTLLKIDFSIHLDDKSISEFSKRMNENTSILSLNWPGIEYSFLKQNKTLKTVTLKLAPRSGSESITNIESFLENIKFNNTLHRLIISVIQLKDFSNLTTITDFELSKTQINKTFSNLISKNDIINTISLNSCVVEDIFGVLESASTNQSISKIKLDYIKIPKSEMTKISSLKLDNNLESISFDNIAANFSNDLTFLKSIVNLKSLKYLHLCKVVVGYEFILYLSHALENHSNLKSLAIDDISLNLSEGYKYLFNSLKFNNTLKKLDLGSFKMDNRILTYLFKCLKFNTSIEELSIKSSYHMMLLKTNGDVYAYGRNEFYQHGDGTTNFKIALTKMTNFPKNITQLYTMEYGTYAVTKEGDLYACGRNLYGVIDGSTGMVKNLIKVTSNVLKVAQDWYHKVLLTKNGEVYVSGYNANGELGDGTTTNNGNLIKYAISESAIDIAAGQHFTLVLTKFGVIYGSGKNGRLALGGSENSYLTPFLNPHITNASSIFARNDVVLSVINETLYSWGYGHRGQRGDGTVIPSIIATPQKVLISKKVKFVSLYLENGYAITEDDELFGWGENSWSQVQCTTDSYKSTPQFISENVTAVSGGYLYHVYIKNGVDAYVSGDNREYQLPIFSYVRDTAVAGENITLTSGTTHTMILDKFGDVYGYGLEYDDIINQPSGKNSKLYGKTLYSNIKQIALGERSTIALKNDGDLLCAGQNSNGECGTGSNTRVYTPVLMMTNVDRIYKGFRSSFAMSNNTIYAFGENSAGTLGVGDTTTSFVGRVMLINNVSFIKQISIYQHTLILINGSVFSCGLSTNGALGLGDTIQRSIPTLIPTLNNILQVSAGGRHSMFLDVNGIVYGCGKNSAFQISTTSSSNKLLPIVVSQNAVKISTLDSSTSILYEKGKIYSFGYNTFMELGGGLPQSQSDPIRTYPFYRYDDIFEGYEVNFWSGCPNGFYGDYCENNYLLDLFNQLCIDC
eukprot:gene12890-7311_t